MRYCIIRMASIVVVKYNGVLIVQIVVFLGLILMHRDLQINIKAYRYIKYSCNR